MKTGMGMATLESITEEEATTLKNDGDLLEAPPDHYKLQPDNPGKFLWITGPPGRPSSQRDGQVCLLRGRLFLPLQDSLHPSVPTTRRREKSPPRR